MNPDHYDSYLSTAELDRRERIADDARAGLTAARGMATQLGDVIATIAPDSPVLIPLEMFRDNFITSTEELATELRKLPGCANVEPENPGPRIVADLHRKITGGRF